MFIGRTEAEAEDPILCHLMQRVDSLEKTLMLGKTEGRRRRGRQDKMVGWHPRVNGHEFEQAPGDSGGQGSLACCSPWGRRVRHNRVTEQQQQCEHVSSVETEAEPGEKQSKAKEQRSHQQLEEGRRDGPPEPSEGS